MTDYKPKFSPSATYRDWIADLRPGTRFEFEDAYACRPATGFHQGQLIAAATAGYFDIEADRHEKAHTPFERIEGPWALTRTDKTCKPYRPSKSKGPMPWSLEDHWRRMERAPQRVSLRVAEKLGSKSKEGTVEELSAAIFVRTRTELGHVRHGLESWIGHRQPRRYEWLPLPLRSLGRGGVLLRCLFLDILCEPAFAESGTVTHFTALEPEAAYDEVKALLGSGSPLERYRQFMAGR